MNKLRIFTCLFSLIFLFQIPALLSQNKTASWNQFRGPERNGIYNETGLNNSFPDKGPELVWKRDIGAGFSEIIVEGDRIYTMVSEAQDSTSGSEFIAAFNSANGATIWKTLVDSIFFDTFGDGPRSTPIIDGDRIYSLSSYGKLTACSKTDGKILWQVDIVTTFGSTIPRWAFSSSPALIGNNLILEVGGTETRAFVCFDKNDGKVIWQKGEGVASYSSPLVAEINGTTNIIFANQTTLFSYDPDGELLWNYTMTMNGPMSMPVFFDGNKVFISTVRSKGFSIVEIQKDSIVELINAKTMKNDYSSSLYFEGNFYGFNVAALTCISATTGEKQWTKRGLGKGSLILVGDKLLALSDKGKLYQIKATPEAYNEEGKFQALDGKSWTAPSFSDGKLYIRNLSEMACYKFK